jgi:hypothetical protein
MKTGFYFYGGLSALIFIISINECLSDDLPNQTREIADYLVNLNQALQSQSSLYIKATETGKIEPGFDSGNGADLKANYLLFYKGDRFLYNAEIVGSHGPTYSKTESFDGQHYQLLDHGGGTMIVSSKQFLNDVVMSEGHFFFMPFLFIQSGFKTNPYAQLSYTQLTSLADWKNIATLVQSAKISNVELDHQTYLKISDIGINLDRIDRKPSSFDVYFLTSSPGFPMRWDKKLASGEIISSYSVVEMGYFQVKTGIRIPYPKTAIFTHYQGGKQVDKMRIEINEVNFNAVNDDDLAIDPATATRIRDLDHQVYIDIPK